MKNFQISIDELNLGIKEFEAMNAIKKPEDELLNYKSFMAGWICAFANKKR